jgi:hypothetical protein
VTNGVSIFFHIMLSQAGKQEASSIVMGKHVSFKPEFNPNVISPFPCAYISHDLRVSDFTQNPNLIICLSSFLSDVPNLVVRTRSP